MGNKDIVLIGGGGHAFSVADAIESSLDYSILGYTDESDLNNGYKYLGTDDVLTDVFSKCPFAAVGVGFLGKGVVRDQIYTKLKTIGYNLPQIVDESAVISKGSRIAEGTFVGKATVINSAAVIGKMCIINTGAIIEHRCVIGDFTHVAVGAVVCGEVQVADHTLIGANSTVIQGVRIGAKCIVGAGSIVLGDVPDNTTVIGVWKGVDG